MRSLSPTEGIYDAYYAHGNWSADIKADPDWRTNSAPRAFVTLHRNDYPKRPGVRRVFATNVYDARALVLRLLKDRARRDAAARGEVRMSDEHDAPPELPDTITAHDREPGNLYIRAGYLRGMAERCKGDDRLNLLRASRSLRAYADLLQGTPREAMFSAARIVEGASK